MSDELKPIRCGCGGEAEIIKHPNGKYTVSCTRGGCMANVGWCPDEETAIEAWNKAMGAPSAEPERKVGDKERVSMVWKPAKGRPVYEKGVCSCGYVLSVLQRDYVYCPMCGSRLEWNE